MDVGQTPSGLEGSSGKFNHSCAGRDRFGAGCFLGIEKKFWDNFKTRAKKGKMKIGVAHSMLMAGVYKESSDKLLKKCGFQDREMVEHEGPERAAHDMIELIKNTAIEKRKAMGKKNLKEVDVTVATIGDSRTGKSEMAEKMEGVLNMSLI